MTALVRRIIVQTLIMLSFVTVLIWLGLSISKAFAELLGGTISVTDY